MQRLGSIADTCIIHREVNNLFLHSGLTSPISVIELESPSACLTPITLKSGLTKYMFFNGFGLLTKREFHIDFSHQSDTLQKE